MSGRILLIAIFLSGCNEAPRDRQQFVEYCLTRGQNVQSCADTAMQIIPDNKDTSHAD